MGGGNDTPISTELLKLVDIISPNESEFATLIASVGLHDKRAEHAINESILQVLNVYPQMQLLFKQGAKGSTLYSKDKETGQLSEEHHAAFNF